MKLIRHLIIPAVAALCLTTAACKKSDQEKADAAASDASAEPAQAAPKPRGEEFTLVAKLPASKRVAQQILVETQIDLTVAGKAQPTQQHNVAFELAHDVSAPGDEGNQPIETELVSQTYDFSAGDQKWTFDSDQDRKLDGKNAIFKDLRKAVGGSIKYEAKTEGGAVKLAPSANFQKSYQAFQKRATRSVSPSARGLLGQLYSPHAIAKMLLIPNGLPDKPVAEGDTWTASKLDQTPAGLLQADSTYTFEGWSERGGKKVAVLAMDTVYKKPEARPRAGGTGGGGGEPGGAEESMEGDPGAGGDDGATMDEGREAGMAGEGGSEPGGGDSKPAEQPAAPEFGPGEIGKAAGKIYFDPESGLIVESVDNQKFQISSTYMNQPRVSTTRVKYQNKIQAVTDPPATK